MNYNLYENFDLATPAELMEILRQFDANSKGSDVDPASIFIRHFDVLGEVLTGIYIASLFGGKFPDKL